MRTLLTILSAYLLATAHGADNECECVDYWLCVDGKIVTDGTGMLDIRSWIVLYNYQKILSANHRLHWTPIIPHGAPSRDSQKISAIRNFLLNRTKTCPGVEVCCMRGDDTEPATEPPVVTPNINTEVTPRPTDPPIMTNRDPDDDLRIPVVSPGQGCGRRRFPPAAPTNKVSGLSGPPETTFYGEVPWMVVVLKQEQSLIFKCGGTLIKADVVLTAAHCVQNVSVNELSIKAGEYDNRVTNKPVQPQTRGAKKVVIHPQFNFGNLHNDIALIFLDSPVQQNEVIDIICGPDDRVEIDPRGCFVAGWGRNSSDGRYQAVLSKVNLELRDRDYCVNSLRNSRLSKYFILHPGFICAGGGDSRDTCLGDGGGPLACPLKNNNNKLVHMGIVSWGIGCGEGYPTVLASVKYYLAWIQSQL